MRTKGVPSPRKSGVPVSEAVSKIISGNYIVLESLRMKIVNYHALGSMISSEVAKLELAGGMVDMTVAGKAAQHHQFLQVFLKLEGKFGGTPYVFQLPNSVKIIAEEKDAKLLEEALWGNYETSLKKNVAKITIRLSSSAEKVPGITSYITELLFRNGVSILDAFLSYEDVVLVTQERMAAKAYQVLTEEISK